MTKNLLRNKLIKNYETSTLIRGLIQLVPFGIGAGVDTALVTHLQNIRYKRYKIFFDEFLDEKLNIQDSLLNSEDFLHCYFKTLNAALNTRRDEKIKMFAKMLKSATLSNTYKDIDEYEELLNILDELSYRELFILFKMDKYVKYFKAVNNSINVLSNSELKKKFYTELKTDNLVKRQDWLNSKNILTVIDFTGIGQILTSKIIDSENLLFDN